MADRVANLLAAAALLVEDAVQRRLERELPRTASAPAAIVTIAHRPRLSIDHLREALGLTHSGAVRLVDRLAQDGLVRRSKSGGRAVGLTLTRRGRYMLERLERARLDATTDLLDPLGESERRQLDRLLSRLLAARTSGEHDLHRICRLCSFAACVSDRRRCPVADAAAAPTPRA